MEITSTYGVSVYTAGISFSNWNRIRYVSDWNTGRWAMGMIREIAVRQLKSKNSYSYVVVF